MSTSILSISPWGNSHGIRLSRGLMQAMGIEPGAKLQARVTGAGKLEIVAKSRRLSLAAKLKAFDPAVHGGELMADEPVGVEFGAKPAGRRPGLR
jgi:antitoxin MazE